MLMRLGRRVLVLVGLGLMFGACSTSPSTGSSTGGGKGGAGGTDGGACVHVDHYALCGDCEACLEEKCCAELTACTKIEHCIECVSNDPAAPHLCFDVTPGVNDLLACSDQCDPCYTGMTPPCELRDGGIDGAGGAGGGGGGGSK
ncbi:MAG: hypothetical protein U0359_21870 [Byssovorax sp.]